MNITDEAIKRDLLLKKQKTSALKVVRRFVSRELSKYKENQNDFRTLAIICDVNPPRIAEAHKDRSMNESTLKKFLERGFIKLADILNLEGLTDEGKKYLRRLLGSDSKIADAGEAALSNGYTVDEIAKIILEHTKKPKKSAKK